MSETCYELGGPCPKAQNATLAYGRGAAVAVVAAATAAVTTLAAIEQGAGTSER